LSKLGRRKRPEGKKPKVRTIGTRLTEEEYRELLETCERLGITPAHYLRHLLTKKKPPKVDIRIVLELCEGYKALAREVNAIGVNLNQLARYVNWKREFDIRVLEKISRIEEETRKLLYVTYEALEGLINANTSSAEQKQLEK